MRVTLLIAFIWLVCLAAVVFAAMTRNGWAIALAIGIVVLSAGNTARYIRD